MNAYGDLDRMKGFLDITGTDYDTMIRKLLEAVSRVIDRETKHEFFGQIRTRYFNGAGVTLYLPDLLSITTLKVDTNDDGTYEDTYAENTDFILYPLNEWPKIWAEILSRGSYGGFGGPRLLRGVEVIGLWGFGNGLPTATPYIDSGVTVTVATDTGTTVTASAADAIAAGQTILAGTEQMYVQSVSGTALTVIRGVNGTTAAAQAAATAYIWQYPADIEQACLMQTSRLFSRKDTSFATIKANTDLGTFEVWKGPLDPEVAQMLSHYVPTRAY